MSGTERIPAPITGFYQSGDTFTVTLGLENGENVDYTFSDDTTDDLFEAIALIRYALGWDVR